MDLEDNDQIYSVIKRLAYLKIMSDQRKDEGKIETNSQIEYIAEEIAKQKEDPIPSFDLLEAYSESIVFSYFRKGKKIQIFALNEQEIDSRLRLIDEIPRNLYGFPERNFRKRRLLKLELKILEKIIQDNDISDPEIFKYCLVSDNINGQCMIDLADMGSPQFASKIKPAILLVKSVVQIFKLTGKIINLDLYCVFSDRDGNLFVNPIQECEPDLRDRGIYKIIRDFAGEISLFGGDPSQIEVYSFKIKKELGL